MRNEPVLTVSAVVGLLAASFVLMREMGWLSLNDTQYQALMNFVGVAVAFFLPIIGGLVARGRVTPVDNPKNNDGEPLMTAKQALELVELHNG